MSYCEDMSKAAALVYSRPDPKDLIVLGPCSLSAMKVEFSSVLILL